MAQGVVVAAPLNVLCFVPLCLVVIKTLWRRGDDLHNDPVSFFFPLIPSCRDSAATASACAVEYNPLQDSSAASNDVILEGASSIATAGEATFGALAVKGVVGLPIPVSLRCGEMSVAAVFHIGPCSTAFEMSPDRSSHYRPSFLVYALLLCVFFCCLLPCPTNTMCNYPASSATV